MGRTNPTQRDGFDGVADELERLARGHRRRDQAMPDELVDAPEVPRVPDP